MGAYIQLYRSVPPADTLRRRGSSAGPVCRVRSPGIIIDGIGPPEPLRWSTLL